MNVATLSVSARGLGGTSTLALFMVHEVDLIYVPAHSLPPMALIQSDLWGVLQYLQESENKTEIMRREGRDSPLLELLVGVKKYFAKVIVVDANKSN